MATERMSARTVDIESREQEQLEIELIDDGAELLLDSDSEQQPHLSIVLPTLNEAEGIGPCLERIKSAVAELGVYAEVLVSDSSTDATPEIAEEHNAIVLKPDGEGYGYAYRYAFERARGEYIVMGDADCTYDFRAIPELLSPVLDGEADMVLGSRLAGDIEPGAMPALHRYVGNPVLTRFLNLFYRAGVTDAHSGFRILSREALETLELQSDGMEFASEMVMDAAAKGLTIREVPITYSARSGEATLDSFQDGWRHVKFMLVNAPGYLFSAPGMAMGSVGLLAMALSLIGVDVAGVTFGIHTMIAGSLLTIAGYEIASLGVFATIAGNPIRKPNDPLTEWILDHVTLERGASVGLIMLSLGSVYAAYLVFNWLESGMTAIPLIVWEIVAFTAIVLGIQLVFGSFFFSAIVEKRA